MEKERTATLEAVQKKTVKKNVRTAKNNRSNGKGGGKKTRYAS